jgi:hypothetical protein
MRIKFLAAATLAVFSMAGCATTSSVSSHRNSSPAVGVGAQSFVDDQMSQTLSSIDHSLKTLLILDRGGEAPRKAGPIGTTVAGAAASERPAVQPPVSRVVSADPSVLDKRARIQWYGPASQLLSTLAKNIGYRYEEVGAGAVASVRIPDQETTVRELLSKTASQIEGQADIRVDTINKRVQLIHN